MRYRAAILDKRLMESVASQFGIPVNKIFNDPRIPMPPEKAVEDIKNEKLLFQVLKQLPNWGVGRLFIFKQDMTGFYDDPTYWRITRVLVDQDDHDLNFGIAWGIFTWKGWCEEYEKQIPRINRHGWRLIPKLDEPHFTNFVPKSKETKEVPLYFRTPPLLTEMLKAEKLQEKSPDANLQPMIKLLLDRNRECIERQRLDDGSLV
ncbi:small ribosomal subunit protein mS34-like [Styela clava]|uniref:28S ribosomal protein S34, mitochondrial-like n=1 Tax=Styela clava TaxID=7725 RepID=UPI001939AC27|nr:28S ribosomal protein S34, mitochondrial-like [Styela clava]